MMNDLPSFYFYIPPKNLPKDNLIETSENYWQWQISVGFEHLGRYAWTLQTYLYLKATDFPCQLTTTIPTEGIVISHRQFLPNNLQPGAKLLIICLQADRVRHPYAQLHVVQNPRQQAFQRLFKPWESYYITHWPQPQLIPRNPSRGDRFENVAFFGLEQNLIPDLRQPSWSKRLSERGLNWQVYSNPKQWNNYREVDVVVAVRSFGFNWDHTWKPATKLYNAWHAGVPAILGCESAYQSERKSSLDYLEANSLKDLISKLEYLRNHPERRNAMIENGRVRAQETLQKNLVMQWRKFLTQIAVPKYIFWTELSSVARERYLQDLYWMFKMQFIRRSFLFSYGKANAALKRDKFVGQNYRDL